MWLPLALLAFMAIFSAYDFLTGPLMANGHADFEHLFGHFGLTATLSLIGLVVGVGSSIYLYKGKDKDPVSIPPFANRFYIDEIYEKIIAIFQDGVGKICDLLDRYLIEPLVARFPAMTAMTAGSILRIFQMGNVQTYAFMFAISVVALIIFLIS